MGKSSAAAKEKRAARRLVELEQPRIRDLDTDNMHALLSGGRVKVQRTTTAAEDAAIRSSTAAWYARHVQTAEVTPPPAAAAAAAAMAAQVVLLAEAEPGAQEVEQEALGSTAQGPMVREAGPTIPGSVIQGQRALGIDLGGRARLSKPRSIKVVDEIVWASAQQTAIKEISVKYKVTGDIEAYYTTMCAVGQQALADIIHTHIQSIYDARCAKQMSRARRRLD
jgi:hypothetical protein